MGCTRPLRAYISADPDDMRIKFGTGGYVDRPITIPCGKCPGCRAVKAAQWSVRCMHEAYMHNHNCVITLTYDDENLPTDYSVNKRDLQLFFKRLRAKIYKKISYFGCGEYGDKSFRPHYHVIIFGYDFPDKFLFSVSDKGSKQYVSNELSSLWTAGYSTIGDVTLASCRYVAGYIQKKLNPEDSTTFIKGIGSVEPEFAVMSRRPGIGSRWFDEHKIDCNKDFLNVEGTKTGVPSYYRKKLKEENPVIARRNQLRRRAYAQKSENLELRQDNVEKYYRGKTNFERKSKI